MYDVCIVGAGIAGASLAAVLGRNGKKVALVDRNWSEAEDIVGELLQPGGVQKLDELGLSDALENLQTQTIEGYAINLDQKWLKLDYPENGDCKSKGYGFRYSNFVSNLRKICKDAQEIDCIDARVTNIVEKDKKVVGIKASERNKPEYQISAKLTVISQGSLKTIGKPYNKSKAIVTGYMLGMIIKGCELPFHGHGHVIITNPSPVLTYPVGNGEIRVLIDIPKQYSHLKGKVLTDYLLKIIMPQIPNQLQQGFEKAVLEGDFKAKPTNQLTSRPVNKDGVLLLGDSLNMRHPITGGGMTVALTDVKSLSDQLLKAHAFDDSTILRRVVSRFYKNRHQQNGSINMLAYSLYRIFKHESLKVVCFEYLRKGGPQAIEPMAILSGISRRKSLLLKHFFAVAFSAFFNFNVYKKINATPIKPFRLLWDATNVIVPMLILEIPKIYQK